MRRSNRHADCVPNLQPEEHPKQEALKAARQLGHHRQQEGVKQADGKHHLPKHPRGKLLHPNEHHADRHIHDKAKDEEPLDRPQQRPAHPVGVHLGPLTKVEIKNEDEEINHLDRQYGVALHESNSRTLRAVIGRNGTEQLGQAPPVYPSLVAPGGGHLINRLPAPSRATQGRGWRFRPRARAARCPHNRRTTDRRPARQTPRPAPSVSPH